MSAPTIDAWWRPINPDDMHGNEALFLGSIKRGQPEEFPDVIEERRVDSFVVSHSETALIGLVHRYSVSRDKESPKDDTAFNVDKTLEAEVVPGQRTIIENERGGRAGELVLYFVKE